jgi:hypothetical protein
LTTPTDIAFWRPCWYCGLPLDDIETDHCADHGPIGQVHEPDPTRTNLLGGLAPDAIADLSAHLAAELPDIVAGDARAWATDHGFTPQEAGDYAGRAAGACRAVCDEVVGRQTAMLLEERRRRQAWLHAHLIELARVA